MAPIRIGLIGLSTTSESTNWAGAAHLPYLQSPQGQKRYAIVALCNSSVASAKKSIEHYGLPSSTKTYDSAAELARDPDVDLVVNVTSVERHYQLLLPVVQAGKNVFTELPLASEMKHMKELLETAEKKKIKTVFGMQGPTSLLTKLLRGVIADGKIGKVLSTTWTSFATFLGENPLPIGLRAFTDRNVGANIITVHFLHNFGEIIATLGELDTFQSILGNQHPSVDLIEPKQGGKKVETVQKDTPDHVFLQGRLQSGALISYTTRGGDPFPGQPGLVWLIYGDKGEIRITNPVSTVDVYQDGVSIEMQTFGEEGTQKLELPKDELSDIGHPAQNVGRIYEAYADGVEGGDGGYANWQMAMQRHELIDEMWRRSDSETAL